MSVDAAVVPMSPLITVLIPWLVDPAEPPKSPKVEAAPSATGARHAPVAGPAVNVQTLSAAISLAGIARSFTPVAPLLIVAV